MLNKEKVVKHRNSEVVKADEEPLDEGEEKVDEGGVEDDDKDIPDQPETDADVDQNVLEISGSLDGESSEEEDQVAELVTSDYGATGSSKQSFTVRRLKHKIMMERKAREKLEE